jgi:FkbM family methyltransferase
MLFPITDIFIDGGGGDYIGMERYLHRFPASKVYAFEPNPALHKSYDGKKVTLIKKAIWTANCIRPFYISKDSRQIASTLLQEKLCKVDSGLMPYYHEQPVEVECLDFSEWLKNNIPSYHNTTLKLDIEGAEYDVLAKMIEDGTITRIKKLYVEFHLETLESKREAHSKLLKKLKEIGLKPEYWD